MHTDNAKSPIISAVVDHLNSPGIQKDSSVKHGKYNGQRMDSGNEGSLSDTERVDYKNYFGKIELWTAEIAGRYQNTSYRCVLAWNYGNDAMLLMMAY